MECKVCHSIPVCLVVCFAYIVYVHSTHVGMTRAWIHLGLHKHDVSNGKCSDTLDIVYRYVVSEVVKTPTAKELRYFDGSK